MLEGIPLGNLTAGTLAGLAVILILLGKIVPRSTYNEKKEEAEKWRLAYEKERDARTLTDSQVIQLLELAKTTHNLMVAVFATKQRAEEKAGDVDVASPT